MRRLLSVAAPLCVFYAAEIGTGFVDSIVAGRLGAAELSAVGVSSGVLFAMMYGPLEAVATLGVFFSTAAARQSREEVDALLCVGFHVACFLSLLLIAAALAIPEFLSWSGQGQDVEAAARTYLQAVAFKIPIVMVVALFRTLRSSVSSGRIVLLSSLVGIGTSLVLTPTLALGGMGLPALGVRGIGFASVASNIAMLSTLARDKGGFGPLFGFPDAERLGSVLRLAWPSLVTGLFESGLFASVSLAASFYGLQALAATTIAIQVCDIASVLGLGIGEASMILVASAACSGDRRRVMRTTTIAVALASTSMGLIGSAAAAVPREVMAIFLDAGAAPDERIEANLRFILPVAAMLLVCDGSQLVLLRVLKGVKDGSVPMVVSIFALWGTSTILGIVLVHIADWQADGIWPAFCAAMAVTATLLGVRLRVVLRRRSWGWPELSR